MVARVVEVATVSVPEVGKPVTDATARIPAPGVAHEAIVLIAPPLLPAATVVPNTLPPAAPPTVGPRPEFDPGFAELTDAAPALPVEVPTPPTPPAAAPPAAIP